MWIMYTVFFSFPFLYYVLVTEENLSFGFWSLFNSHFSSLSDPKEAVVHNLSLSDLLHYPEFLSE